MFYGTSSQCCGLVCSVWLWYFLIILILFVNISCIFPQNPKFDHLLELSWREDFNKWLSKEFGKEMRISISQICLWSHDDLNETLETFILSSLNSRQVSNSDMQRPTIYETQFSCPCQAPRYECVLENQFFHFSYKTYEVGTQKNRLNETVLLSTQNICLN